MTDATGIAYGGVDARRSSPAPDTPCLPWSSVCQDPAGAGHRPCHRVGCQRRPGYCQVIVVDNPGSGYSAAPTVTILDAPGDPRSAASRATAAATLTIQSVFLNRFGSGYTSAPTVTFSEAPALARRPAAITISGMEPSPPSTWTTAAPAT